MVIKEKVHITCVDYYLVTEFYLVLTSNILGKILRCLLWCN